MLTYRGIISQEDPRPGDHLVYGFRNPVETTPRVWVNNQSHAVTRQEARQIAEHIAAEEVEIDMDFYILWYKLSTDTLVVWYEGLPVFADVAGEIIDDRAALAGLYT